MERKYELTEETTECLGHTLHRIRALRDFGDVHVGDLGGFIESEHNLSHIDNCWVYDNAKVFDRAQVTYDAKISNDARVHGHAWVTDFAMVYGNANVYGYAKLRDGAAVFDDAAVCNETAIWDNARVYGKATIQGDNRIFDSVNVYGNAIVNDTAHLCGDAIICGCAVIHGAIKISNDAYIDSMDGYLVVDNIGSRYKATTIYKCTDDQLRVTCGCFTGTLDEFREAVIRKHEKHHIHLNRYLLMIDFVKQYFDVK